MPARGARVAEDERVAGGARAVEDDSGWPEEARMAEDGQAVVSVGAASA
jgi:hypothetical protein